jgi:hypothetical protein
MYKEPLLTIRSFAVYGLYRFLLASQLPPHCICRGSKQQSIGVYPKCIREMGSDRTLCSAVRKLSNQSPLSAGLSGPMDQRAEPFGLCPAFNLTVGERRLLHDLESLIFTLLVPPGEQILTRIHFSDVGLSAFRHCQ